MTGPDWTPFNWPDFIASHLFPALLAAMAFGAIVLAAVRKGDF